MAFTFKDVDRSYERPKSEETTEMFIYPFKTPEISSVHSFEILEMQEEEKYIQNIRHQRLKIEQFKNEVAKKDKKIGELEQEIYSIKQNYGNYKKMAGNYQNLADEIKLKEEENISLRSQLKKQVDDYEHSLKELQAAAIKEREEKNKEIRAIKMKLNEKETKNEQVFEEISSLNFKLRKAEEGYERALKDYKDKEKAFMEQKNSWKSFERLLKDQVSELSHEKNLLQEKMLELKSQLDKQKISQVPDSLLSTEKKKNSALRQELELAHDELSRIKKSQEDYLLKTEYELKSLQNELERAVGLVSRQENSIIELRMRKSEDDISISNLNDLLSTKEDELNKITSLYEQLQRENDEFNRRYEYTENNFISLKEENKDLKNKIIELKNKEEALKDERKQIARMKMDLFNQRNAEVNKLTDVLDEFISNKS
jgi:chromosome segregation ATPase